MSVLKNRNIIYFLVLSVLILILGEFNKLLLNIDELFISTLSEQLTSVQIEGLLNMQEKWEWLGFALIPILLLIKVAVIALIIDLGCFFFNKEIKYKKLFNIVVKAEFIFLLVIVFKTIWFYFFKTDYTFEDLQYSYPLSALSIVGYEGIKSWLIYPFQVLNLFEVAYWFILAYLLGKELGEDKDKSLSIVLSSYGTGLLIWVVGVVFLTLYMS